MADATTMRSRAAVRRELLQLRAAAAERELQELRAAAADGHSAKASWPAWKTAFVTSAVSLLVAIIGGWTLIAGSRLGADASVTGAKVGAEAALDTSERQLNAERDKETRQQRAAAYARYLAAANQYYESSRALYGIVGASPADHPCERNEKSLACRVLQEDANRQLQHFYSTRAAFQAQVDQVAVFGSDEAWGAHLIVAAVLPPAVDPPGRDPILSPYPAPDWRKYLIAYAAFQRVFCKEGPVAPRSGCG